MFFNFKGHSLINSKISSSNFFMNFLVKQVHFGVAFTVERRRLMNQEENNYIQVACSPLNEHMLLSCSLTRNCYRTKTPVSSLTRRRTGPMFHWYWHNRWRTWWTRRHLEICSSSAWCAITPMAVILW